MSSTEGRNDGIGAGGGEGEGDRRGSCATRVDRACVAGVTCGIAAAASGSESESDEDEDEDDCSDEDSWAG